MSRTEVATEIDKVRIIAARPSQAAGKETPERHPRYRLDDVVHAPVRLSIMAALAPADEVDFRFLRDVLEVSDSLLSKHLSILEQAGYLAVHEGYERKRPRTWSSLTEAAKQAFAAYRAALNEILEHR